ncbi:MAG: PEP-CTERM sorting domain-containing protein [Capsulimonadales bacterium]|nr:PEP-CTERM sorting domain-containing protein [Capsulimonadales bacterium]
MFSFSCAISPSVRRSDTIKRVVVRNAVQAVAALSIGIFSVLSPANAQNLITNGDFEGGNFAFDSDYLFVPSPNTSITPGTFAIRTNPRSFNPLLASFGDHTTGSGNMMLVDGGGSNRTIWSATINVVPNEDYSLTAFAATTASTNFPLLRFLINNVQVGTDLSLSSAVGTWQQFSAIWNAGFNNTATIRIVDTNANPSIPGDDSAIDDLSFVGPAVSVAPEPGTFALLSLVGLPLVAGLARRK